MTRVPTRADRRNIQIGLKLWSPNLDLVGRAAALYDEGWIDLVELYVVPGSFDSTIAAWKGSHIPFMLHCPHAAHKFNLAKPELLESNVEKFREVQRFGDALYAEVIVVHGGNRGDIGESIRQLRSLSDHRIHLENKPKISLTGGICIGHSPEEVAEIIAAAGLAGFVLDFGHATCAANSAGVSPFDYIERFMHAGPRVFHIGDGDQASKKDQHLHLGHGNCDIARLLTYVPEGSVLTIETPTDLQLALTDFVEDVRYLRTCFERASKSL